MTDRQGRLSLHRLAAAAVVAAGVAAVALALPEGQSDIRLVHRATLAAQQAPPVAGQAPPQFRAAANFVRVDVYATTKDGPVLDLGQNDFEVYEDGVLQKVDSFEHIVSRKPVPEFERSEPRSDMEAQEAVADPRTRLFVVVFDTLHTFGYKGASQAQELYDPRVGRPRSHHVSPPQHRRRRPRGPHAARDVAGVAPLHPAPVAVRGIPAVGRRVAAALARGAGRRRRADVRRVLRSGRARHLLARWWRGAARCASSTRCAASPSGWARCGRAARRCSW